jgi:hypothetical protein
MLAPVVKPLGISAVSASVLVFIESVFLGSLPTLALVATFVGPFVPLVVGAWSRRTSITDEDANEVYTPLFAELVKVKKAIADSEKGGSYYPFFQNDKLDPIRLGGRYLVVKDEIPAVGSLFESMEGMSAFQGEAYNSAARVIKESVHDILKLDGNEIFFLGRTRAGSVTNFSTAEIPILLVRESDPVLYYPRLGVRILSMVISGKDKEEMGKLEFPRDTEKYRLFWDAAKIKAEEDQDIRKMRTVLKELPHNADEAEAQVFKKIKKSRSIF